MFVALKKNFLLIVSRYSAFMSLECQQISVYVSKVYTLAHLPLVKSTKCWHYSSQVWSKWCILSVRCLQVQLKIQYGWVFYRNFSFMWLSLCALLC